MSVVRLVRHGETASYDHDAGLTPRGERQASEYGARLARSLGPGTAVQVCHAPTERARATAETVCAAGLEVAGFRCEDGFRNLAVLVDGRELDPTQARAVLLSSAGAGGGWAVEARRFWRAHEDGDAMGFWLRTPLLWHESPASVVRRLLATCVSVAGDGLVVAATHSGCLRALVAWAAGADLGEPENAEEVRVGMDVAGGQVTVGYRAAEWTMPLPPAAGLRP